MSSNSAVIKFAFKDHKEYADVKAGNRKHTARCVFCSTKISERLGTSSAFTRHLNRKHKEKYEEYIRLGKAQAQPDCRQQGITSFLTPLLQAGSSSGHHTAQIYNTRHPRQKAINNAVVKNLIVGCSLPLSFVENPHFREFMEVLEPRYTPMARSTLRNKHLRMHYDEGKQKIKDILEAQSSVSITTDIWSDRVMRSFLGVTVHVVIPNKSGKQELKSLLLRCQRFHGSHTGERIASTFDEILEEMGIKGKVNFVITDNASNMKAAFDVRFPACATDASVEEELTDALEDESLWQDFDDEDDSLISSTLESSSTQRLSCFAHTLQLVVKDGLIETKGMALAIAKSCRLSSLIHRSTIFKERFENVFGQARTIPAANKTRWNSTLHQLKAILALEHKKLVEICSTDFVEVAFSAREWSQLRELCDVLNPFADATNLTQGDQVATISLVVPTVLDLNSYLKKQRDNLRYCKPLTNKLLESLQKRFRGIFVNCQMSQRFPGVSNDEPFSDKIYLISAVLDPRFCLSWVDIDVLPDTTPDELKSIQEKFKETLQELLITEAEASFHVTSQQHTGSRHLIATSSSDEEDIIPAKVPRLLAKYNRRQKRKGSHEDTARKQLAKYIDIVSQPNFEADDAFQFWHSMETKMPSLFQLAYKVLSVPASSAPVERVFSCGGIIMRPHRARLSADVLSILMFLKCNESILY